MVMTLGLVMILVVVGLVLEPLIRGRWASLERENDEPTEAEAVRRVKLLALRDTEYDYQMGKLDEADYQSLRSQLSAEALAAMADFDSEQGIAPGKAEGAADLEAEIAAVRAGMAEGTTCVECGHRNPGGSRFCGSCGASLQLSGSTST